MYKCIDILKADSVEKLFNQYWLNKKLSSYQVFTHLSLERCSSQEEQKLYFYI